MHNWLSVEEGLYGAPVDLTGCLWGTCWSNWVFMEEGLYGTPDVCITGCLCVTCRTNWVSTE